MQLLTNLRKNAGFVAAMLVAATLGGAVNGVVRAAIPHSQTGTITGCRRNATNIVLPEGNLRTIDAEASETCATGETEVSWDRGRIAYGHIRSDGNGNLNFDRSKGIQGVSFSSVGLNVVCIDLLPSAGEAQSVFTQSGPSMGIGYAYVFSVDEDAETLCPGDDAALVADMEIISVGDLFVSFY
jgi:hypothetical protein